MVTGKMETLCWTRMGQSMVLNTPQPITGKHRSSQIQRTWTTFDVAIRNIEKHNFDGIGLAVLTDAKLGDSFVGFDFESHWRQWNLPSLHVMAQKT
jgi:hypothetical protein